MDKTSIEIRGKRNWGGFLSERIHAIPYHVVAWLPKVKRSAAKETIVVSAGIVVVLAVMVTILI